MPNPLKGEVELKTKDKIYILRFSIDALCQLEAATGRGFNQLAIEFSDPSKITLTLVRDFLHAALTEHQPEMTVKDAGEIIPAGGGMIEVMGLVSKALQAAFPEASGTPRPNHRAAQQKRGTGPDS